MTLTCNPALYRGPDQAVDAMSAAIPHLFKRIRRRLRPAEIQYFLIWEYTEKGWPHAHLLLRAPFIPKRWLSKIWQELTGAQVTDIRRVPTAQAAVGYVTKYLTKQNYGFPGHKRWRCSRGWFLRPGPACTRTLDGVTRWRIYHASLSTWLLEQRLAGFKVSLRDGKYGHATKSPSKQWLAAYELGSGP